MRIHRASTALAALVPLALAGTALDLRVEPDDQNVAAGRLAGTWVPDPELSERLGTKVRVERIEIASDPSIAGKIPAQYNQFLGKQQIFLAGTWTWREPDGRVARYPFVLVTHHGNPHAVFFRERDGDPFGDAESCNLVVVPARERENDLLFLGGDFNNEPFRALRRAKE